MAKNNVNQKEAAMQENLEHTVSSTEKFFTEHGKLVWSVLAGLVIVGLAILLYNKFIYQRQCEEAMEQAYPAEQSFQASEYEIALNGDGNNLGFADLIDNYGAKAGKALYFYAGVCELNLGNYEGALSYLKKYKGKEPVLAARAKACEGDAYVGLEDYRNAVACFEKAVALADNVFASAYLVKAGLVYEALGDKAAALKCYNSVKNDYPQSIEAYDINSYIARVSE